MRHCLLGKGKVDNESRLSEIKAMFTLKFERVEHSSSSSYHARGNSLPATVGHVVCSSQSKRSVKV